MPVTLTGCTNVTLAEKEVHDRLAATRHSNGIGHNVRLAHYCSIMCVMN